MKLWFDFGSGANTLFWNMKLYKDEFQAWLFYYIATLVHRGRM